MASPNFTQAARAERVAAERRVHGALLGYQPLRMKPVHFASSLLLAITGTWYRLEWLNKAAVPKATPKDSSRVQDEYPSERLYPLLIDEHRLDKAVPIESFRTLRAHLNAAYNNDGSALAAAFSPYTTYGADYSAPSLSYISNLSKNHGQAGSFVVRVLERSADGREALEAMRRIADAGPPPLAALGAPLLDQQDEPWTDPYEDWFGVPEGDRLDRCAALMEAQTRALRRLLDNLEQQRSAYALRYAVIGFCVWLFTYMMRLGSRQPLLLVDALQGANPRVRSQSRATYARQLDLFASSYDRAVGNGEVEIELADWDAFASSLKARESLDSHFRDLGVRIGIVQPRAANAKHKHAELQADTLRVLTLSLLEPGQLLTLPEFGTHLRETWSLCLGADPRDPDILREHRIGPLDLDDDLQPNAAAFAALLVRLGLAVEPSDGLTLVAINAEELF